MRELAPQDFQRLRLPQPLADDEIHLWFFPQWQAALSGTAESMELRQLLAAYLGIGTADLCIERGEHGKPRIAGDHALEFNLSHSGGALLLGLSRSQPLGVDMEVARRTRPVLDLARRYFDPAEAATLAALPEALRQSAFLRLWSCKEAALKAHGRGIGYGLQRFAFDLDSQGRVAGIANDSSDSSLPWQLLCLTPIDLFVGALAWHGPLYAVRAFTHA